MSFVAWRRLPYTIPLRLRTLFRRAGVERDLDDELRFHVERQVAESVAQGMTPQAARQAALRDLHGIERGKEACRQVRKLNWVFDLIQDVRYGVRILRQRPTFTLIAVATLALGIGANTAIFSVVDAVLVRPLPYPQPQQLLTLDSGESLPALEDIQRLTRSFAGIGAYNVQSLAYTGEAEPLEIYGALCTADLFPVLGATPLLGRAISAQDDRYGAARVALLTYAFWQSHFAGDTAVLGKAITLDGNPYTVIGVMPPEFWKPGRKALGAPTARLVRQMLAESIPLVVAGGGAGLLLAWWGVHLLAVLKPADLPRLTAVRIDGSVLAFTFGLCALTSVVFGALPALGGAARANLSDSLKAGARGSAGAATIRLRMLLVVAEVALALVLLVGAGLLVRSFHGLTSVEPGFNAEHVLTLRLELPAVRYRKLEPQRRFRQRLLEAVNALPGVQAAMISKLPMSGDSLSHNFVIAGRPPLATGEEPELQSRTVAGNYFRVLRIPLLRGRAFAAEDHAGTAHVVVVNQAFVEQYFPHQDPVGAHIAWARDTPRDWMTIIGVAGDVRHFGPAQPERPAAYDLYSQTAQDWKRWMFLVVRSWVAPSALRAEVNRCLGAIDNQIPPTEVQTMVEVAAAALARPRFNLTLMGIFAALALALAAIGIYGVTAYTVTQRTQEIGIRIALGARHGNVLTLLLGQCAWLTLTGAAIGTAAALGLTRLMASLLFGVTAQDPLTFAAVAALLVAVALLAALLPARRAMRIDPVKALRTE